jgi:DnaJ-domain-containing protein 1
MSIGKRLFNLARSELNSLLDSAVEAERGRGHYDDVGHDPDADLYHRFSLDQLTDAELEAEIERRHKARQESARARSSSSAGAPPAGGSARSTQSPPPGRPSPDHELRLAYAALEVPFGADFATVRKSYRQLMRKYHPDRHTSAPDKQKAATELTQKLSQAYALIEKQTHR